MNNKNILKLTVAALTCVALCGTTLAAPRGHGGRGGPGGRTWRPAPTRHHRAPAHHHHHGHHERDGWITLGAGLIGGLIGGIVGACR